MKDNVTIIGASSAGLFAAYLLARGGLPVRLYDQGETLGPPPRTLIVTRRINQVLGFVPAEAILNRIHHIELLSRNASARVSLKEPDLVLERESLLRLLAAKARGEGAEIELGHRFLGFEGDGNGLVLSVKNRRRDRVERVRTRFLIGADGPFSNVARAAQQAGRGTVAILQARVVLPPWADADTVKVWFDREATRFFYWLIPESSRGAAVGLISEDERDASEKLRRFLKDHRLEAIEYQAAQVSTHALGFRPWRRIGGSDVLLVGDAAGQVKMTTVGGVVTGLRGARAAARAILRGTAYGRELRALKRELDLHWWIRRVLDRFADADYDRLLDLLNGRAKGILETHSRDEMARALWGLLLAQPQWLLLGARALLRPHNLVGGLRS
ncbi:MAG TPA: NAD(P)/FAD-dependent oxidoreductase [Anaerolineae bacterium]|nr:NAD(P)/FAD-dependent oxidoreductase [Anaerolineae bacterium]